MGDAGRHDHAARGPQAPHARTAVTVNPLGWSSVQRCAATTYASIDVACLQETWLEATKSDAAHQWAARRGWQLALSPAERTPAGGLSGGVAVCVRACYGMKYLEGAQSFDLVGGRVASAIVEVLSFPAFVGLSVYLRPAEQLSDYNRGLLATIGAAVAGQASRRPAGGPRWQREPRGSDTSEAPPGRGWARCTPRASSQPWCTAPQSTACLPQTAGGCAPPRPPSCGRGAAGAA